MFSTLITTLAWLAPLAAPAQEPRGAPTDARSRAQQVLAGFQSAGHVPGVSAGISDAHVVGAHTELALAAGRRDLDEPAPLEVHDLMCAGSTGKTFVAAVVLQLVSEKKLLLDALAGEYLGSEAWFERLPNAGELTVANLLGHRSGLPRYEFQPEFARDLLASPERVWKPAELLGYVLDHKPECAANEGFAYADTNYIVLGMIVERVSGASLYAEIERRLLKPLGLQHVRAQDARFLPGLVQGHAGAHDPLGFPERVLDRDGRFAANPQFEWAGGGFVTSGGDLARWARALYAGPVLAADVRAAMLDAQPAPELGRGVGYGLGAIVWSTPHGPAWGHEGFFPGYLSCMRYWPEHDVAVAVQVNTSEFARLPKPLGRLCEDLLVAVLGE